MRPCKKAPAPEQGSHQSKGHTRTRIAPEQGSHNGCGTKYAGSTAWCILGNPPGMQNCGINALACTMMSRSRSQASGSSDTQSSESATMPPAGADETILVISITSPENNNQFFYMWTAKSFPHSVHQTNTPQVIPFQILNPIQLSLPPTKICLLTASDEISSQHYSLGHTMHNSTEGLSQPERLRFQSLPIHKRA